MRSTIRPRERVTVRVQAAAREADEHVALAHAPGAEHPLLLHTPDDEAREVVVGRRVQPGHLGGLAAHQRAAVLAAPRRDARDHRLDRRRHERAERDVIEEEQRRGALHEDVVHAVVDEVVPDRVVAARLRSRP